MTELALVIGIAGALGGSLISFFASQLTLRSTHRAERMRWLADRRWEHGTALADARRKAYTQFLFHQNAMIMAVGKTAQDVQKHNKVLEQMPPDQSPIYHSLQDAYAQSLLLAGPALRQLLTEGQAYLDELVWASWRGDHVDARDDLYNELMTAMYDEAVAPPLLEVNQQSPS